MEDSPGDEDELMAETANKLNFFPPKNGVSENYSPREILSHQRFFSSTCRCSMKKKHRIGRNHCPMITISFVLGVVVFLFTNGIAVEAALFGATVQSQTTSHTTDVSADVLQGNTVVDSIDEAPPTTTTSLPLHPSQTLQRGKTLADNFDERDLLQAYREIQSEYRQKAFNSPNDWKVLSTLNPNKGSRNNQNGKDDEIIQVSLMEHPSDPLCPYVKMEAVLPLSVKECWNFLLLDRWDETMPKMDPFYEGVDIFGEYFVTGDADSSSDKHHPTDQTESTSDIIFKASTGKLRLPFGLRTKSKLKPKQSPVPTKTSTAFASDDNAKGVHMILARKRTKRILTFGKREFVFISVKDEPLEDGTWVSGTVSVHSPSKIPRNKGYTRAFQDSIAFYKPLFENDCNTRTKLTIVCRIDLNDSNKDGAGGWIPMWLYVKTIGATGVRSVMNMRKALLENRKTAP
ncbi:START domain containing protein [Nitzschia inconspicua]|uniref:START domain containing protein n=1 Tax=Nitzschia inconspicua TaxID=303405 RepID=A0A9K3M382_9STRA|nr:START domain containing protein [Nitzschia inconspicua]